MFLFRKNKVYSEALFSPFIRKKFGYLMQNFLNNFGNVYITIPINEKEKVYILNAAQNIYFYLSDVFKKAKMILKRPVFLEKRDKFADILRELYNLLYHNENGRITINKFDVNTLNFLVLFLKNMDKKIYESVGDSQMTLVEMYNYGGRNIEIGNFLSIIFILIIILIVIILLWRKNVPSIYYGKNK
jgi:hypothetical protein